MFVEFFAARDLKTAILSWGGVAVIVGHAIFSAWVKYRINSWYSEFYDILQTAAPDLQFLSGEGGGSGDSGESGESTNVVAHMSGRGPEIIWDKLVQFAMIVLPLCIARPLAKFSSYHWSLAWRISLMRSYVKQWSLMRAPVEGASQRVHEDTQRFASGLNGCIAVVMESVCTLIVFAPVLVRLGAQVVAPGEFRMLGDAWLFALTLVSATVCMLFACAIGNRLVVLEVNNQRVEAELRKELVLMEATASGVVCRDDQGNSPDGEGDVSTSSTLHSAMFVRIWEDLKTNYHALFTTFLILNTWLSICEQYIVMIPYGIAAPLLFAAAPSTVTLGTLIQLSNAFSKVFDALNVVGDNWDKINEFCACVVRLRGFESSICKSSGSFGRGATLMGSSICRSHHNVQDVVLDNTSCSRI